MVDGTTTSSINDDARENNRKFLFRKFLGDFLQALQVFANIKNGDDYNVYYTSYDKPASIMLQILLYSLKSHSPYGNGSEYPHSHGFAGKPGNYGGHIEKYKRDGETDPKKYRWKVNYYHPRLDLQMLKYRTLMSPPTSPVTQGGGGTRKKRTKRKNTRRKSRKNTRRKNTRRKNTRRKSRKNTRRKNTRRKSRKNTRRKNTRRKSRKNTRRRTKRK